jgi:5-methyltetrahydropteroyltriglutamate--homocysteine methyltransferase
MTEVRFLTREIGSLAKPSWRVKAFAGRPLEEADVAEAERWGQKLKVEGHEALVEGLRADILSRGADILSREEIDDWAALYAVRLLERTGLDVVYDGEQRRTEMYDHVAAFARGFEPRGTVRSFDNKYYAKAAVVEPPSADGPQDVDEYRFVASRTDRTVKVPLTGAYTMVDWSYDEHYAREGALGGSAERRYEARRQFVADVAERVIRLNAQGLVDAGADWLQIDEPAATTKPNEVPLVVEGFNAALRGIPASRKSMHICFSDYSALWPAVLELQDCLELQLEFANRDSRELGTRDDDRPGYVDTLRLFREHSYPNVGLGVLDIHSDFIEPAELVRDRILYAVDVLGDPNRVQVNPDCGLRTRSWDVVYEKLVNMVEGTRLAEHVLNRAHAAPARTS